MLLLQKPSEESVRQFLLEQAKLDFNYPAVGGTAQVPPAGYVVDHTRVKLGEGRQVFNSAKAALERWEHFQLGWAQTSPRETPIEPGQAVAVLARAIGLWWVNACRIVYVVDEPGPPARFGFAYGTLPDHVEKGEERFLVEWNQADNSVWYDILAFSRPNHLLTRAGYPWVRRKQKRFARESAARMQRVTLDALNRRLRPAPLSSIGDGT
ncbi:MAG: DUF1990 domain-containing protein [Pirellulales bacterium]